MVHLSAQNCELLAAEPIEQLCDVSDGEAISV
jgi:hypothetical protein